MASTAPAPAPPARPAPDQPATGTWYQARSTWAGKAIDTSKVDPMEPPWRITVHHSAVAADAIGDAQANLRNFERTHTAKGWACIGYHYIVARDGTVFEGRPIRYQGAHATGENNKGNIGVCLMGDFEKRPVPKAQRDSLIAVLDRLRAQYGIRRAEVEGHSHYKTTDCPGKYLKAIVRDYQAGR